jgi:predicted lipoprotein
MTNLADNIFIPNYKSTAEEAVSFASGEGKLSDYCDAIDNSDESVGLADAKLAWLDLMERVQKTEMHIVGPAERNGSALQSRINSYPLGSLATCALDQAVVLSNNDENFSVSSRALNQRGMGAIEYLLFDDDLNHSCSSQALAADDWSNLSDSERKTQRCNYAVKLANDVADASQAIYDRWILGESPYRTEFLSESSLGDNFQLVTDALFYLETFTKSQKLAIPLGINPKCSAMTCPDLVESPFSQSSLRNIKTNTQEFLRIFNGGSSVGFDDLIDNEGYASIANRFKTQSKDVIDFIDTINVLLTDQIASIQSIDDETTCTNSEANPDDDSALDACSLAGLLKKITDDLKIEFVSIVNVPVPGRVQSDND